jgi:hypothetical protein
MTRQNKGRRKRKNNKQIKSVNFKLFHQLHEDQAAAVFLQLLDDIAQQKDHTFMTFHKWQDKWPSTCLACRNALFKRACDANCLPACQLMLEENRDRLYDRTIHVAFLDACQRGHLELVRLLITYLHHSTELMGKSLNAACSSAHDHIVTCLLEGWSYQYSWLLQAVGCCQNLGSVGLITQYWLRNNADKFRMCVHMWNWIPLHLALPFMAGSEPSASPERWKDFVSVLMKRYGFSASLMSDILLFAAFDISMYLACYVLRQYTQIYWQTLQSMYQLVEYDNILVCCIDHIKKTIGFKNLLPSGWFYESRRLINLMNLGLPPDWLLTSSSPVGLWTADVLTNRRRRGRKAERILVTKIHKNVIRHVIVPYVCFANAV